MLQLIEVKGMGFGMRYFFDLLKNVDKALLIMPAVFAVISIVMVGSTSYAGEFIFSRDVKVQLAAYIIGACALFVMMFIDYAVYANFEKPLYVGSIAFLLTVYIPHLGVEHYGARSWINLGVTDLQPSEFVKISFAILLAIYLSRHRDDIATLKGVVMAAIYAAPFILIVLKEDLGTAIVYAAMWIVMVFYAGIAWKLFFALAGVVACMLPASYFVLASHQKERIDAFLHPDNLQLAGNYQVWQSKVAIGSGGLFGKGLFRGTQKNLDFLPVQKSDFIFSVIAEELGLIGGAVIIALYAFFLYRIVRIAREAKDLYGALIVMGFIGMFGFQIFENIGMTMGIMPVTGITLPFISYGGSSVLANMAIVGLIANVGFRNKIINF